MHFRVQWHMGRFIRKMGTPLMVRSMCLPLGLLLCATAQSFGQHVARPEEVIASPSPLHSTNGAELDGRRQPIAISSFSAPRATHQADGQRWMQPYLSRAATKSSADHQDLKLEPIPADYVPWWDAAVRERPSDGGMNVGVDWLVQSAIENSPSIQAIVIEPRIRQTELVEACAGFDWQSFLESTYDDLNDPVGNTLTTGNNDDRFEDRTWWGRGGLHRTNERGGEFEISQRLGRQSNNSVFLVPNPQSTTRLELNYTQPLLRGGGRPYNMSRIVLARIETNASRDEVILQLQNHLLKVTEAYWELYRARSHYYQRVRLLEQAQGVAESLAEREQLDAIRRQVLRAQAAVARRKSEIVRANTQIRNAEAQLRLLVNDPVLLEGTISQLVPLDSPSWAPTAISMSDSLVTALMHRPDISRAIRVMRATNTRAGVAKHEILPRLDLFLNTYVAGLEQRSQLSRAWGDQFADGRPGFSVGVRYEKPIGNRAAKARYQRQQWEIRRAMYRFKATVERSLTEAELAVREVFTTYAEMIGRFQAMVAAQDEMSYLADRFQTLPGTNDSATLLLEDLLDSQERLADEEAAFTEGQVQYSTSLVALRRALGTLLNYEITHGGSNSTARTEHLPVPNTNSE